MLRKSFNASAAAAAIALSLTACGGGGGGTSALPSTGAPTTTPTQSQSAKATMTIKIPARTLGSSSKAQYISASTQSMTIGLVGSDNKTTQLAEVDLTPSSKNCSALSGGGLQCTVVFIGPAGKDERFELNMYDKTGGNGNLLSTGQVVYTLTAGQNTNIPIALDGVPSTVTAALSPSTLQVGTPGSAVVVVEARDHDNNVIVGPGGYSSPITLAISGDKYNTLSLVTTPSGSATPPPHQPPTVTAPGQLVTLQYNGGTNVGSTITPSIGGKAGTAATFAGSGAALTQIAPALTQVSGRESWLYPQDVTALPGGKAAVLIQNQSASCCPRNSTYIVGIADTNGYHNYYVGDTTDPFNPGTSTSPFVGQAGVSVVHGMSTNFQIYGYEQQHTMTADGSGNIVYSASFSSTAATNGCAGGGGTLNSGVIGVLNPTSGTTSEHVLKGVPEYLQTDTNGNVWFVETTGSCNGTALLPSGYGIGELKNGGGVAEEVDFGTAGINASATPSAMSIKPDGSAMYIADYSNNTIVKVALPAASSSATASFANTLALGPLAMATSPDGTTMWMSDNAANNNNYFYGSVSGTAFGDSGVKTAPFPVPYFYGYDMTYADGSFWGASYDNYGFARFTVDSTGTPMPTFVSTQSPYYVEPYSLSAGGGYIWATDDDYYTVVALQYGAPSTATTLLSSVRRVGPVSAVRAPAVKHGHARSH